MTADDVRSWMYERLDRGVYNNAYFLAEECTMENDLWEPTEDGGFKVPEYVTEMAEKIYSCL